MNHHTHESPCPSCQNKIQTACLTLQEVWDRIKSQFPDCHIAWAWRGEEDQNRLYREGKTKCLWPNSKHNREVDGDPCSEAVDLFQLNEDGKAIFLKSYYKTISQFLDEIAAPIQWAGHWNSFIEYDHFQMKK